MIINTLLMFQSLIVSQTTTLSNQYINIKWDEQSKVSADFNYDKMVDEAYVGYEKDNTCVGFVLAGKVKKYDLVCFNLTTANTSPKQGEAATNRSNFSLKVIKKPAQKNSGKAAAVMTQFSDGAYNSFLIEFDRKKKQFNWKRN